MDTEKIKTLLRDQDQFLGDIEEQVNRTLRGADHTLVRDLPDRIDSRRQSLRDAIAELGSDEEQVQFEAEPGSDHADHDVDDSDANADSAVPGVPGAVPINKGGALESQPSGQAVPGLKSDVASAPSGG